MEIQRRTSWLFVALTTIFTSPTPLRAEPIIISVTSPPALSFLVDEAFSTSWSQSGSYTDVSIAALVDGGPRSGPGFWDQWHSWKKSARNGTGRSGR